MIEFPQVAEIVLGAGSRPRALVDLHGQAGQQQALDQALIGIGVSGSQGLGPRQRLGDTALHQVPGERVDGVEPDRVRQDPVGAGGDLGGEIAVAGCHHGLRRRSRDVEVEDHDGGGGARHGDLDAALTHRCTETGVSVHGCRCPDDRVWLAEFPGGQFDQIVERPGADRDTQCVRLAQAFADLFGVLVGGIQRRGAGEDQRLGLQQTRLRDGLCDGLPGGRPGALIGHDEQRPLGLDERLGEDLTGARQDASSHFDDSGVARVCQAFGDGFLLHGFSFDR